MWTEGDGRLVREGGFTSFRTQPFPQGRTFLCVASRVGYVLGVHTFVILFRELERLSPVCDTSNSYIRARYLRGYTALDSDRLFRSHVIATNAKFPK